MHIHVLGYGAIGTLVAHHLRATLPLKHLVSVIHKTPALAYQASEAGGIKVERDGVVQFQKHILHESPDPYDDYNPKPSPIESLIVAVKAQSAIQGIMSLLPRISSNSTIVLLHNGMGVYENLIKAVFRNREQRPNIVVSVNNHGAFLKQEGHVVHTGVGDIKLGIVPDPKGRDFEVSLDTSLPKEDQKLSLDDITPLSGDPLAQRYVSLRNTITALTSAEQLNASWQPIYDVQVAMRCKLAVNAVVNPLTALLNCKNGELFEHPEALRLSKRLCAEASIVFWAQWEQEVWAKRPRDAGDAHEDADKPNSQDFPRELSAERLMLECERVAKLTSDNVSSMLVDVRRGRQTEIEYISGYLFRMAQRYKVPIPVTAAILDLMRLRSKLPIDKPLPLNSVL
ncbi:ketopantoate reductase-like protein [Laetiporus sulphureus 93-53]|uniref:2-dehydropantoate 2-reductase n=1 Tax=Laetiporus sulphureus 93-53 TaxID=1314785 RepID=A0A165C9E2_9APHY|nr:ketopantoate reductase-like protein [Laetiporus sulphureus 93-53]KZT02429.1 ketopantoate reductase-like protein [Laetiporus sulphureus 93-53]